MSKIYKTWCERIEAPEMSGGLIRQFRQTIAGAVLCNDMMSGHSSALTYEERADLWNRFQVRVRRDGGPLVTPTQAEQGRIWLDRYAKRCGLPTDRFVVGMPAAEPVDYRHIARFRFVDVLVVRNNGYRCETAPVYECEWDGQAERLRYAPTPWQAGLGTYTDHYWVTPKEVQAAC